MGGAQTGADGNAEGLKCSSVALLLALAMVLQVAMVLGMLVRADIPLWVGEEVRIAVQLVDPRSPLRGNYVSLRYDIGSIPKAMLGGEKLKNNQVIYVKLKPEQGLYVLDSASTTAPEEGVFLRGRLKNTALSSYPVEYGIEAFFVPVKRAQELEKNLQQGGVAVLKVTSGGRSALQNVVGSGR